MGRKRMLSEEPQTDRENRIAQLLHAVELIPRGTRMEELKAAFLESVINKNNGIRSLSAIELDIPIRTLRSWIYEKYNLNILPPPYNAAQPKANEARPKKDLLPKRKKKVRKKHE